MPSEADKQKAREQEAQCPNCGKKHNGDEFWCSDECRNELFARPKNWPGSVEADRKRVEQQLRTNPNA